MISSSSSWDNLWARLTAQGKGAVDNKTKGDVFERLTQLYLQTAPEYQSQLANVWRANDELPADVRKRLSLPKQDVGIDLIAKTRDGHYWTIQCKFRTDQASPLTYKELSTFSHLSFVSCKNISLAVVVHTTSKPIRKQELLKNTTEIGLDRWLSLTPDDWARIKAKCRNRVAKIEPRKPRPHQQKAIAAAKKYFADDSHGRGRLIMPCGTGKSLTAFWIAEALQPKSILVAVPSLALIRQSLTDWTRELLARGTKPDWLVVCSDDTTGKLDQDEFVGGTYDLGIPTTTDQSEIAAFLRRKGQSHKIIFTTYQSSSRLAKATKKAKHTFDLAILDEAHKTVGVKEKAFATLLFDKNISIRQRLFMTATERVLRGKNDDVLSMDDEIMYGQRFFLMTFKEAIEQDIISDYKIITMTVSNERLRHIIEDSRILNLDPKTLDEAEAQSVAAGIALKSVFKKHRIKHAISFHRSIKSADQFRGQQDALNTLVSVGPRITNLHISSQKTTGERVQLMKGFTTHARALITNARCLTEGVDVPAIDCVLFADPKQSVIDIVQASGRALRRFPGKTYGYILVPLVVPGDMTFEDFAETTAFKQVARVITSLSTQDERIAEEFRAVSQGRKPSGKIVEIEGDVPVGMRMPLDDFAEAVSTKVWERVGRANWRSFEEARLFARDLKLRKVTQWQTFASSDSRPPDIPAAPERTYAGVGWIDWRDWLGSSKLYSRNRSYLDYDLARAFVARLGLKSLAEWRSRVKSGGLPQNIPSHPDRTYRKDWKGFGHWLGTNRTANHRAEFLGLIQAREFVRALGLSTKLEWDEYARSGKRPVTIPAAPHLVYRSSGWSGWRDWLGRKEFWIDPEKLDQLISRGLSVTTISRQTGWSKSGIYRFLDSRKTDRG